MSKKLLNIIITLLFCLAIFTAPALFFLLPKEDFSEREKRYLAEAPTLTLQSLSSGAFTEKLGSYTADHFPGRSFFVGLNAYYDLLSGRQNAKEYFLTWSGRLLARPADVDQRNLDANVGAVRDFGRDLSYLDIPVNLMLVPSSGAVLLPERDYPDEAVINYVYEQTGLTHVDLLPMFRSSTDREDLYYRTDHHWTSEGAFQAACAYRNTLGLPHLNREDYTCMRYEPFYGSAYAGSGLWLTKPDSLSLWYSGKAVQVSNETGSVSDSVFYLDRLNEQDKYTVYLDGNHSLVRIENLSGGPEGGRNLLVIRDSFSNSLGCFLADLYDKVVLVDLRYYKLPLLDLILDEEIDEVLIEYSVDNFLSDTNLAFLSLGSDFESLKEAARRQPNYFAPPPEIDESMFDGAYYLGDSVIGIFGSYCVNNRRLVNTTISTNALLSYYEVAKQIKGHLIYNGEFSTLPRIMRELAPRSIIAALGCNDLAGYDTEYCEKSVLEFLDLVRQCDPDIPIFLQSVMPIRTGMTTFNQQEVDEFNTWLRDNAETYGYCYIELDKPFKGPDGTLSDTYMYNNTHINLAGGSVWFKELMNVDNYTNFPEEFYVEYDGATGLPVDEADAGDAEIAPEPEEPPREETMLDAVYAQIAAELACPEMLELSERTITSYLGLRPEDFADGRFYLCANNLKADEIWLVELADEDAAAAMLDKARERIAVKGESYAVYLPEESEIIRQGIAVTSGRYAALFISPDAERMQEIFLSLLSGSPADQ